MKWFIVSCLLLSGCGEITPLTQPVEVRQDSKRDRRDHIAAHIFAILLTKDGDRDMQAREAVRLTDTLIKALDH